MVARIGHYWDAAAMKPLIALIAQTMVVVQNIAGIQSYDEYDELREKRRAAEKPVLQAFQETNDRGAKAFRDRVRELIMPFFCIVTNVMALWKKTSGTSMPCSPHSTESASRARHRVDSLDRPPSPSPYRTSCAPGLHGISAADRAR